ncbi:fructosamine kinase family protein [Actinocorallia sp. A-T 12471]|uniref:fructosamine kinase family protein n=1 Tax=Actinocorallia sp. A-T 12471 TaxID=3089813 RepID=UPI0029D0376E|nr:fructosamine kinase family protein [Actinocorallia sp. A-T 12471]MDX6741841.1 fructosamine kinase family protein [Actinocorallia sp. A-T 12471]
MLGVPVARTRDLGSRHSWTLHHVTLEDGRELFVKKGYDFSTEARGLRWLGSPCADVLEAEGDVLVLPWLPPGRPDVEAARRLGRDLAAMHARGAPCFGASWPGHIADLPLDNTPGEEWTSWYAERRVLPYLRSALDAGALTPSDVRAVEDALGRARQPAEPPSRIHGDLWSGNVLYSGERAHLVDAAAHGGHRETDLAMLALFGAPHLDQVLAAYDEAAPLADGWRERVPLHQLHPLAVHVVLFGGSYRASLLDAAARV